MSAEKSDWIEGIEELIVIMKSSLCMRTRRKEKTLRSMITESVVFENARAVSLIRYGWQPTNQAVQNCNGKTDMPACRRRNY